MHARLAENNSEPCAFDSFFLNHANCTWKEFSGVNLLGDGIYKVCSNVQLPVEGERKLQSFLFFSFF